MVKLNTMKYSFKYFEKCNMCETDIKYSYVLGKRMNRSQGIRPKKKIGISTTIMKCSNCELIFPNPLPVPENIDQHYGVPPEDYWTKEFLELSDNYFKPHADTFKRLYGNKEDMTALDIGAGTGLCVISLKKNGFEAYGLEPSEPFYERAITQMGISKDRMKLSTVEDAEYDNEKFDFITFGAVLEHLYSPSLAIKKSLQWLKPNGLIHIEVPSSKWLTNKIYNLVYRVQGLDYVGNISPMHTPFHLYEFGLKSFELHSQRYNYKIAQHKFMVCETFLPKILNPIIKPIMDKTNTGMELEVWLRKTEN